MILVKRKNVYNHDKIIPYHHMHLLYQAKEKAYRQCLRLSRGMEQDAALWCYPKDLVYAQGHRQLALLRQKKCETAWQAFLNRLLVGRTSLRRDHLRAPYELGYTEPALMTRHAWNDRDFRTQCGIPDMTV